MRERERKGENEKERNSGREGGISERMGKRIRSIEVPKIASRKSVEVSQNYPSRANF